MPWTVFAIWWASVSAVMGQLAWVLQLTLQRYDKKSLADVCAQIGVFVQNSSCSSIGACDVLVSLSVDAAVAVVNGLLFVADVLPGAFSRERVPCSAEVISIASRGAEFEARRKRPVKAAVGRPMHMAKGPAFVM